MPTPLIAAAILPKASTMATATAFALSAEENLLDCDTCHHIAPTSFIGVPKQGLLNFLGHGNLVYDWVHTNLDNLWHKLFHISASPDQGRMVEYYAAGCPHCHNLEPIWKQAVAQWSQLPDASKVVWEQKQCLDEHWKPGRDYQECQEQYIDGFPTIKFYPPSSKSGDDFMFNRSPDELVNFAQTGIHPNPLRMPREEHELTEVKLVDYYSAACPHCKALDPVWKTTEETWENEFGENENAPLVGFEKKECYDDQWKPGHDFEECKRLGIKSFPTIKIFMAAEDGHGFRAQPDYVGARTPDAIVDFLKQQGDLQNQLNSDQHDDIEPTQEPESFGAETSSGLTESHHEVPVNSHDTTESDRQGDVAAELPKGFPQAVQTALMPLPLVGFSCCHARVSSTDAKPNRRMAISPRASPPIAMTQFL